MAVHAGYDAQRALIPAEVTTFVQSTQPKPWAKLQGIHGAALDGIFLLTGSGEPDGPCGLR